MKLGIYAPYNRSEVTASALRLARLAIHYNIDVDYVVAVSRDTNVHPAWDHRVTSARRRSLRSWSRDNDCCVWFAAHKRRFTDCRKTSGDSPHIYVPMWHRMNPDDLEWLSWYDRIVCPCQALHTHLSEKIESRRVSAVTWARFTAGLKPVIREGPRVDGQLSVVVPVDPHTMDTHGVALLDAFDVLMTNHEHLRFTLLLYRAISRAARKKLGQVMGRHNGRLQLKQRPGLASQLPIVSEHDWTLLPGIRDNTAIWAQQSLALGLPVIAWDIPPMSEMLSTGHNAHLIPCGSESSWLGAPTATWNATRFLQYTTAALYDEKLLSSLQQNDWGIEDQEIGFDSYWTGLWGSDL